MSQSYVSPKLEARRLPEKGGHGVFACQPVKQGERLLVWGGDIVTRAQLDLLPANLRLYSVQVEEGVYLAARPYDEPETADYINHSCNPNAGFDGQIVLVAMRDIQPDEEICIDYAMCDGSPYDEFACQCGSDTCRGRVTGNDWQLPELQARYGGYFMPYLQRRMKEMAGGYP
jgi:SET domain-containing protein